MNWLIIALISPALDTLVNFTDKYIIEREVKDYRGMPIYGAIVGLVFGTIYWVATGFPILELRDALIIIGTGILSIFGLALYFKALASEETSSIIIFLKGIPVMVLVLSFIFLKEVITFRQLLGFAFILFSVIGVSYKKTKKKNFRLFSLSSPLVLILIVDSIWAISAILIKFAINANTFPKVLSYESWGVGIGGVILYLTFPTIRNAFHKSFRTVRKLALGVMFINEGVFVFSRGLVYYAYSLGPAALVSVIGGVQVFYGIILGLLLTLTLPKLFKEDVSIKSLKRKVLFAIILFLGIYLVY